MERLRDWNNGKKKIMPFAIPMVWRESKDHITDGRFYMINVKGINRKNKHHVQYSDVPSTIWPILRGSDLLISEPDVNMEYNSHFEYSEMTYAARVDAYKPEEEYQPVSLTQLEFNNLTRDLNLSKESA